MRFRKRSLIWLMIIALAGQGMAPGLVLCRGAEGHAAVETVFDQCCSTPAQACVPAATGYSLDAIDPPIQEGCVSCSDTPILANPLLPPSHERHTNLGQMQYPTIATMDLACCAKVMAHHWAAPLIHPLIPVTTSVLLI